MQSKKVYQQFLEKKLSREDALRLLHRDTYQCKKEQCDLTESQKGIYSSCIMFPNSYAYNAPGAFYLNEKTDNKILEQALQYIIDKHTILRSVFVTDEDGKVIRKTLKNIKVSLPVVHIGQDDDLYKKVEEETRKIFDLENGPLFRCVIFVDEKGKKYFFSCFHHLIYDGLSAQIFTKEIREVYQVIASEEELELNEVEDCFDSYVTEEKEYMRSEKAQIDKDYWINHISLEDVKLQLAGSIMESGISENIGASYTEDLDDMLIDSLQTADFGKTISMFTKMLSAYILLLYQYGNQNDLRIGIPVANRNLEFEDAIGCYINMMVIRKLINPNQSVRKFVSDMQYNVLDGLEHSKYPYYDLVKDISKQGKKIIPQLFQTAFYFNEWNEEPEKDFSDGMVYDIHQLGEYDLALEVMKKGNGDFSLHLKYNKKLFEQGYIRQMLKDYKKILKNMVEKNDSKLQEVIKCELNNMDIKDKSFVELFQEQVKRTPQSIAVSFEDTSMTYEELYLEAGKLAKYLQSEGVKKGTYVGILLERSTRLLVSLIAVQMVGGVYIPLDPLYPEERLRYMFEESDLKYIITEKKNADSLNLLVEKLVYIDELENILNLVSITVDEIVQQVEPDDLAYILFTSGSTGKPKGIMISHGALANFLISMSECPGCDSSDILLAVTTICFDIAGLEMYLMLLVGGKIEILSDEVAKDGIRLLEKIRNTKFTIMQATPATWQMLLAADWNEKQPIKILCGGEALTRELADKLLSLSNEVWNMYGPTETTIWSMISKVEIGIPVNLGKPIRKTTIYILDENMNEVENGEIGELYIGGAGVAKGYIHNPQETKRRFIHYTKTNEIIYKTGDLVKILEDGNIAYVGRADFQVKINGFRIELGEIEDALLENKNLNQAVVVVGDKSKKLLAFLIAASGQNKPDSGVLVEQLEKTLPEYMVPKRYIYVDSYPLTLNRKVDRKQLAALDEELTGENQLSFESEKIEQKQAEKINDINELNNKVVSYICSVAAKIQNLPVETIKKDVNLGEYDFDSITFTNLCVNINKHYGIQTNPTIFYSYQTIEEFGKYLLQTFKENIKNVEKWDDESETEKKSVVNQSVVTTEKNIFTSNQRKIYDNTSHKTKNDIAVIGIAGVLPGSDNLEIFWDNLIAEKDLITEVPDTRWDWRKYFNKEENDPNRMTSKWGGFINDPDKFDAEFFKISPREAELIDPQQRLMIQVVWETFENAGYNPKTFSGREVGVFVGATSTDYMEITLRESAVKPHTLTGIANSIIPNRVSYLYNFMGPSEIIDTACSSGLVSICRAVDALNNGECECAIAGGVNLLLSPFTYIALGNSSMLSVDGSCKSFDERANGYVRGEGAAALLLKPLDNAISDGDNIYAVIKGTAVNHGGKANSITAPNPNAQCELIKKAYHKAGVDPSTVDYIETHGSGTALGDPIEINGLTMAFDDLYKEWGIQKKDVHCGLGAVKTNIGHLEAVSGVAGILKMILSMKHKKVPANIHFHKLNPYIHLENTPFFIRSETKNWENQIRDGKKVPLRGGVSSFGFGGTNAHVLVEEYLPDCDEVREPLQNEFIVPISAQYIEGIYLIAKNLLTYLHKLPEKEKTKYLLSRIAYTLQIGREAMKYRKVFVVSSVDDLETVLTKFTENDNKKKIGIFEAKEYAWENSVLDDSDVSFIVERYLKSGNINKLAKLWEAGIDIDWSVMYPDKVKKLPLPAYPFHKERFYLNLDSNNKMYFDRKPHPLIDETALEESLEEGIVFHKTLTYQDAVVREHVVKDNCVMPGTSYLEMALEGVGYINPLKAVKLSNVVWYQQLIVNKDKSQQISLNLLKSENGYNYKIQTKAPVKVIHGSGHIELFNSDISKESIDINAIKARCNDSINKEAFYKQIEDDADICYGSYFQGVKEIYENDSEVLGILELPEKVLNEQQFYYIHPVIMDCALQVMGRLVRKESGSGETKIPFSVEEITINGSLNGEHYYVYVSTKMADIHNIYLLNENGEIQVFFKELVSRKIEEKQYFFVPRFEKVYLDKNRVIKTISHKTAIIYQDETKDFCQELEQRLNTDVIKIHINDREYYKQIVEQNHIQSIYILSSLVKNFDLLNKAKLKYAEEGGILNLFCLVKALQNISYPVDICVLTNNVYQLKDEKLTPINASLYSFSKSVMMENQNLNIRLYDLDLTEQTDLSTELDEIIQHSGENEAYIIRESCWYERKIKRLKMSNKMPKSVCFKQRGTYLIVGMGGIGIEIGKYLASKYNASILFVSRSKINEERTKVIEEIKSLGGNAFYYQTDITDTYDVRNTMQKIKIDITNINGVILGAMVLKDMTIMSMTEKSLMDVVRPKAEGTIELFKELRKEQLDFVLFLSSVNALIGSPGQSNYCAACAIQDALADAIRNEIKIPVKIINWSYWGTVGAVSSNAYNQRLMNKGLYPIYEKEGMRVIEQVLAGNENQVCFCKASDETLQEMGFETAKVMKTAKNDEVVIRPKPIENKKVIKKLVKKAVQIKKAVAVSDKELENRAIQWIKEEFASLLKMDVRKLGNESNVEQIGIDSLLIIEIHKKWSKLFPQVPSTLLFEYNTIGKIAEYLLNQYQAELKALLVSDTEEDNCEEVYEEDETVKTVETEEIDQEVTQAQLSDTYILEDMKASDENFTVKSKENISYRIHKDIAIIGVSGMYPMADDIYEFWDNIKKGKDCTSTIPRDRWNWEDYFDPSNKEQGKSYSKWGGFLRNVKGFDAEFFGITKEQAKEMDPQERLLLESTWSTLEDAGYPGRTLSEEGKKVGVFLGTMYEGYNLIATKAWENGVRTNAQAAHWILPNKISHYFDFNGPSISFDTACASSMTALHYACRSIQNGDCSLALAGGINLILYPRQHVRLANLNSLSRSGKNMSFSQNADGYVEGEGVGTVLLKPLEDAIRDNDYIYGVVKASNVNCNGGVNTFTMPNLVTQSEVMKESLSQAALEPEAINYVEAHAAGTLLGDPVEVSALNKVFYTDTSRKNQCPIATVKANIGHVEAASGVAALTKVLLQMKYKKLVPSINCEPVSSMVPIENSAFYINKELRDWNVGEISRVKNLRRACINSNGAGGSNANMIVEEYVMDDRRTTDNAEQIIVISAKNEKSLQNYASRLREFLITQKAEGEQLYLADIAFTLQTGRQDMEYRVAFTVHNYNELLEKLDFVSDVENKELYRGHITQIDLQRNIQTRDTSNAEIARAWAEGVKINWKILHEQDGAKRIPLPTYQFIHKTYWMDARGEQKDTENNAHIIFEHYNGSEDYLTGHYTFGKPTLIGMTYVSLANKLLESVGHRKSVGLNKIMFLEPVSLDVGQDVEISIKLTESKELQCMGAWNGKNVCVCSAKTLEEPDFMPYQIAIPDFKDFKRVEGESLYSKKPNIYGKILHSIQYVYQKENDIWGRLILSKEMQLDLHQYSIHPILLDSAILCRMGQDEPTQEDKYIPFMVKEFYACGTLGNSCYCHIIKKQLNGEIWEGDVELIEEQTNKVIVLMKGVVCKKIYDENENRYQEKTISEFSKKGKEQSIAGNLNQKIINYLIDVISATTGTLIGKQDVSKNLMTIGCDSANIISLSNKIQEDIQIEIYPTVFFEYSSIELLAGYFEENFKEAFAEYLKNHSPVKEIFVEASTIKADENKSQTEENVFPKTTSKDEEDDPIAIIGIGGMFPQASDLDEFWENMIHNKESITTIPKERWDWREYSKNSPDDVNKTNIIWGGFLKDIDKFDADFFGISPREAKHMDPQQRVMLELAWHTIEDAGYNPKDLAGSKTGVFIGAADKDYGDLDYDKNSTSLAQLLTGTVHNVLTGRISYLFDFHGPSEPVDNACASSLVAIIHAAEAIQNGRCDMALAGGVHIMLNPEIYVAFDNLGILSNDGICRAFDKNANGTVRGEGAGLVLLKRLSKAVEDKDHIYAVLKGTGISHGGASNSMTAPNPVQQEAAVVEAFERGNVDPATVGLIETHGTGTVLGDPIEITALKNAFKKVYEKRQEQMPKENYCGIGAVKNHIGHLEPAAGIAGLLKILLCMKNEMLPGLHNFCELNPYINLQNSPFYIVTEAKKWERMTDKNGDELPYRAGISAFGFSGVNAHILLEEYREQPEEKSEINEQLIILSAKNEERLRDYVKEFVDFIRKNSQDKLPSLATMAYTLRTGRCAMKARLAVVVHNYQELINALNSYLKGSYYDKNLYCKETAFDKVELTSVRKEAVDWITGKDLEKVRSEYKVSLPTYPFEKKSYWLNLNEKNERETKEPVSKILLDYLVQKEPELHFTKELNLDDFYLRDHIVRGKNILPGVIYVEMARQAGMEARPGNQVVSMSNIVWSQPIEVKSGKSNQIVLKLKNVNERMMYELSTSDRGIHGQGRLSFGSTLPQQPTHMNFEKLRMQCFGKIEKNVLYKLFEEGGFQYGATFKPIESIFYNEKEAVGFIHTDESLYNEFEQYFLHPVMLEGSLQVAGYLLNRTINPTNPFVPFSIGELKIYAPLTKECFVYAKLEKQIGNSNVQNVDIVICDMSGAVLVEIYKYTVRSFEKDTRVEFYKASANQEITRYQVEKNCDTDINGYITEELRKIVAEIIGIEEEEVDQNEELENYNIDSMLLMEFSNKINGKFGSDLTPAVFFELEPLTLTKISDYMKENFADSIKKQFQTINLEEHYTSFLGQESIDTTKTNVIPELSSKVRQEYGTEIGTELKPKEEPIAIIGMASRMPMSDDCEEFWDNLISNRSMIQDIPKTRFDWHKYYGDPLNEDNKTNSHWGGFLKDIDKFDAQFFNITPKEARYMDPQQRIFFELVWELLEDAGYTKSDVYGSKTGVYLGASNMDYINLVHKHKIDALTMTGNCQPFMVNKISHYFNFTGPSEPIDTLCSSSLVAIHRAVWDIRNGMCETAIAGGINVILSPNLYISYGNASMLSSEGKCKTFDKDADGFVRAEGAGVLYLKPLSKAIEDKDHIYGIIRGSAVNHCGHTKSLTAPSPKAQADVIKTALKDARIDFSTVNYVELHGTGTPLGDPIEINGLKMVYDDMLKSGGTANLERCYLGAVKTNVGHLESAAGIAGVLKILLAMKHQMIPANINLKHINPYIALDNTPFYIPVKNEYWEQVTDKKGRKLPRRAGISSFGAGGVNAHIIFEEYSEETVGQRRANSNSESMPCVFGLSAQNEERLKAYAKKVIDYLNDNQKDNFEDIAYTSLVAREAMQTRLAIIAKSKEDVVNSLEDYVNGKSNIHLYVKQEENQKEYSSVSEHNCRKWVNGDTIEWKSVYNPIDYKKVKFPTYPFRKDSYWIEEINWDSEHFICKEEWVEKTLCNADNVSVQKNIILFSKNQKFVGELKSFLYDANIIVYNNSQYIESFKKAKEQLHIPNTIVFAYPLDKDYEAKENVYEITELVKAANSVFGAKKIDFIYLYTASYTMIDTYHQAISGFLKSIILEYSNYNAKVLEAEPQNVAMQCANELREQWLSRFEEVRYENKRYVKELHQITDLEQKTGFVPFKENGVYLISGGTGKIGQTITKYLVEQYHSNVILTGRNEQTEVVKRMIAQLNVGRGSITYVRADVTKDDDIKHLHHIIEEKFGRIDGIFHLAGKIQDAFLFRNTREKIKNVIAPKVKGTLLLDEMSKEYNLDFFILFSSITAIIGNVGQSDYAYANHFMDAFAEVRNQFVNEGKRSGKTCSINWPLWLKGGMKAPDSMFKGITNAVGIAYLEKSLEFSNFMVLSGDKMEIKEFLNIKEAQPAECNQGIESSVNFNNIEFCEAGEELIWKTEEFIRNSISSVSEIPIEQIETDLNFADYGIDSMILLRLGGILQPIVGNIPNMIFFEYRNIQELSSYLVDNYQSQLQEYFGETERENSLSDVINNNTENIHMEQDDIAIIGISGRYPMSYDLDEFWYNLASKKCCTVNFQNNNSNEFLKQSRLKIQANEFEPQFFNLDEEESQRLTVQDKLLMEEIWKTIEDAGYRKDTLGKQVGIFVGVQKEKITENLYEIYTKNVADNLLSVFDFKGPGVTVTSESIASLEAIYKACESIKKGECRIAIAGAVSILADSIDKGNSEKEEGVGTVLLKPLKDAIKDKDIIYGVIKGTLFDIANGVNSEKDNTMEIYQQHILNLIKKSGISIEDINYIETEDFQNDCYDGKAEVLTNIFFDKKVTNTSIPVGSIKGNFGDLGVATGIAQVTKILLQLQGESITPVIASQAQIQEKRAKMTDLYIPKRLSYWNKNKQKSRCALIISSEGGMKSSMIIQEWKESE